MRAISLRAARLIALTVLVAATPASATEILYRQDLTASAQRCLAQLLESGEWKYLPQDHRKMMSIAVVAEAYLDGPTRRHYIYVMHDSGFCGTAGCSMLIGEGSKDGSCREIYDD